MASTVASAVALTWFLGRCKAQAKGALDVTVECWHTGRCGRCGRLLTVPESVQRGLGPECAERRAA